MFAVRNESQAKKSADNKSERTTAPGSDKLSETNPLWQSLVLRPAAIQPKLAVSQPGDPYEQEADRVADQVMRMVTPPAGAPNLAISSLTSQRAQRKCNQCKEDEETELQRKQQNGSRDSTASAPAIVHEALNSAGHPLDTNTRSFFEPRLGSDLSQVRVHADARAAESAHVIKARAYTLGSDIVFGLNQYQPETAQGQRLLAHELAHVEQQRTFGIGTRSQAPQARTGVPPATARIQRDPVVPHPTGASEPMVTSLSVSLSGMTFVPQGSLIYSGGETRYEAMAAVLRRLLGPRYRTGLEREVWRELDRFNFAATGHMAAGTTVRPGTRSDLPIHIDIVASNRLISVLETQFQLPVSLAPNQRELLALGLASHTAYAEVRPILPPWYTESIFAREMAQRAPLLRGFQEASRPNATGGADARERALQSIRAAIFPAATVLEAIRVDLGIARGGSAEGAGARPEDSTYALAGYASIWGIDVHAARQLTAPPDPSRVREDLAVLFLAFLNTQPQLLEQAGGADGHSSRVTLLARFSRFAVRAFRSGSGDEALLNRPGRANAPPWRATLSSSPPLRPPLFEAALETDHRFIMNIEFEHWLNAFGMYSYLWERIRIPDPVPGTESPTNLDTMSGPRPSMGEVWDVRMRRARRYNATDIARIRERTGVPFGSSAEDLVQVNNIMRIAGTVVRLGFERLTRPQHETQVVFPSAAMYAIRCRAMRVLEGNEEVVRAPSVAYQIVVARDPTEMAITDVQDTARTRFQAHLRIAEIQSLLASPFPPSNRDDLLEEMNILHEMTAEPAAAQIMRRDATQRQIAVVEHRMQVRQQLAALERQPESARDAAAVSNLRRQLVDLGGPGNDFDDERLLRSLNSQLDTAREMIETREARVLGEQGLREQMYATFVSDLGHTISLSLEVFDRGPVDGQREVFISDLTTPNSGIGTGRGTARDLAGTEAKVAAVTAAMRDLLETSSDYGRGQVAFRVDGSIHTLRVEAGTGRLLSEAIESGVMVLSIAAIVAAPFTGGASLYILLPLGVVGAIPSAYRIYNRYESHTLRFDLQTAMDVVNIVSGMIGLAHAATPLRMVRMGGALMILGLGADAGGILLMGAGIVQQIDSLQGLSDGERAARMLEIISGAMIQLGIQVGGMVAHARYQSHGEGPRTAGAGDESAGFRMPPEGEGAAVPAQPGGAPPTERTMGGLGSPREPPSGSPPSGSPPAGTRPAHPAGSPERLLDLLAQGVDRNLPAPRPTAEVTIPPRAGTYRRGIRSAEQAYHLYNEALANSAGREVAVYHNPDTGEFAVRIGSEGSVNSPPGEHGWDAVVHYHPNPANVHTYRLPAPADFNGLIVRYVSEGRAVREVVEFDMPGVGRGRTEFGIDPANGEPFYVRINMSDGTQRTVRFAHDGAYQTYWGERTRHVEPGSPEYRQMFDDIARFLREREGTIEGRRSQAGAGEPAAAGAAGEAPAGGTSQPPAAGAQTMAGLGRGRRTGPLQTAQGELTAAGIAFIRRRFRNVTLEGRLVSLSALSNERVGALFLERPNWLEAVVGAEVRGGWLGRTTATDFAATDSAREPLTLRRVGELLQQATSAGNTGHTVHSDILSWSVWDFVHEMLGQHDAVLEPAYNLCEHHPQADIRARWERFKLNQLGDDASLREFFLGTVGSKRPDVVEVMLTQNEIHIIDASFAYSDPIHNFKTAFYRAVIERLINVQSVTASDYRSPFRQTPIGP
jgi:hypothetical protein